jgi:tetratricopeptide (TPR) repeat protein
MNSRKLILAAVAVALCGGIGWRLARARQDAAPSRITALDKLESKAAWNDPKAQASLAIRLVVEARRTQDPALWDRAALAAQRALAHDPERVDAAKVQLMVMQNQHRFQEVETEAEKLLAKHPSDGFLNGLLGDAQMEMGQYENAAASYQKMVDDEPNAATYGRIAYLRLIDADFPGAIEMGELAARSAPQSEGDAVAWALSDLGDVYFASAQPERALKYFDTALAHDSKFARAHEGRGHALRALARGDEAIAAYRRAVELSPTGQHHMYLGRALEAAGQADQAKAELAQALKIAQGDARLEATILLDDNRDAAHALSLAQDEFQRRQDVFTEDVLAYALLRNGKTAEAAQASAHALRLGTRDARLAFHAGAIQAVVGDVTSARGHYADALQLSPPLPAAQLAEARKYLSEHPAPVVTASTQTHSPVLNHP